MAQCPPQPRGTSEWGEASSPTVAVGPCHIAGMLLAEGQRRNPSLWDVCSSSSL